MASCVRNIRTENYQNLIIGFESTVENVGDVFLKKSAVYRQLLPSRPLVKIISLMLTKYCSKIEDQRQYCKGNEWWRQLLNYSVIPQRKFCATYIPFK